MQPYKKRLKPISRILRRNATEAERILWSRLRCKQVSGVQFYRQKPLLGYVVDFYCAAARLVVEIDGSQHLTAESKSADQARDAALSRQGLRVLRFDNLQILNDLDAVMGVVYRVVEDSIVSNGR